MASRTSFFGGKGKRQRTSSLEGGVSPPPMVGNKTQIGVLELRFELGRLNLRWYSIQMCIVTGESMNNVGGFILKYQCW